MKLSGTPVLRTEHLTLRRFTVDDAPAMFLGWASDFQVTKYLLWPTHQCVEESRNVLKKWVREYTRNDSLRWAIERDASLVGSIAVVEMDKPLDEMRLGFCVGRAWWNRGIATEAVLSVMRFLFDDVGANRVEASCDSRNLAARSVLEKSGMRLEGLLRSAHYDNFGRCDRCIYARLADN